MCNTCGRPTAPVGRFTRQNYDEDEDPKTPRSKTKVINVDDKVQSNEVPKHRRKRLFMLNGNYISESEGLTSTFAASKRIEIGTMPTTKCKKSAKSNVFDLAPADKMTNLNKRSNWGDRAAT